MCQHGWRCIAISLTCRGWGFERRHLVTTPLLMNSSNWSPIPRNFRSTARFHHFHPRCAFRLITSKGDGAHPNRAAAVRLNDKVARHLGRNSVMDVTIRSVSAARRNATNVRVIRFAVRLHALSLGSTGSETITMPIFRSSEIKAMRVGSPLSGMKVNSMGSSGLLASPHCSALLPGNDAPQLFSSTLLEHVFVLRVSDGQCSLRAGADHELGPIYARRDCDERNGSVGILAAADFAFPLAEVEDGR